MKTENTIPELTPPRLNEVILPVTIRHFIHNCLIIERVLINPFIRVTGSEPKNIYDYHKMIEISCKWLGIDWNSEQVNQYDLYGKIYEKINIAHKEESYIIDQEAAHIYYGIIYSEVQGFKAKYMLKFKPIAFNGEAIWDLVCMDIGTMIPINALEESVFIYNWKNDALLNTKIIEYACCFRGEAQKIFLEQYFKLISSPKDTNQVEEVALKAIELIRCLTKSITEFELKELKETVNQRFEFSPEY